MSRIPINNLFFPSKFRIFKKLTFGQDQQGALPRIEPQYLFLDSARTTPITGPGDPVGGATDLSGNNNHFEQTVDADRMIFGRVPVGGRRNGLDPSEDFSVSGWVFKEQVTVESSTESFGDTTFQKIQETTETGVKLLGRSAANLPAWTGDNAWGVFAKYAGRFLIVRRDTPSAYAVFDLQNGLVTEQSGTTGVIKPAPEKGEGVYRCSIVQALEGTIVIGLSDIATPGKRDPSYVGDGSSGVFISGGQLEQGAEITNYQRVGNQFDVTEAGTQSVRYLATNYTNQKLPNTLPAGTYTIILAGTNGTWFDEVTHAGGAFDLGPTTYPGGPDGILEVLGDFIDLTYREGAISATERERIKAYYKSLGSPGELRRSDDLIDPVDLTDNWLILGGGATIVDANTFTVEGDGGPHKTLMEAGATYIVSIELTATEEAAMQLRTRPSGSIIASSPSGVSHNIPPFAFTADQVEIYVRYPATATVTIGSFSLRKLELVP